jgi:hypothetical protein
MPGALSVYRYLKTPTDGAASREGQPNTIREEGSYGNEGIHVGRDRSRILSLSGPWGNQSLGAGASERAQPCAEKRPRE